MPSTKTQWSAPGSYADLPPCSTDGQDYVLKVHSTRCANEVPTPNSYQFVTESTSSTKDGTVDIQTLLTQFLPPIGTENTTYQPVPSPTDQGTASTGPSLWVYIVPVVVVIVLIALGIGMLTLIIWRTRRAKLMRGTQTEATRQPVNRATRSESGMEYVCVCVHVCARCACVCMCVCMCVYVCTSQNVSTTETNLEHGHIHFYLAIVLIPNSHPCI